MPPDEQRHPNQPRVEHEAVLVVTLPLLPKEPPTRAWDFSWCATAERHHRKLSQLQNGAAEFSPLLETQGSHSCNRDGRLVLFYCHCWQRGKPGQAAHHRKFCRQKGNLYWLIFFLYFFYFRAVMLRKLLVLFTSTREVRFYVLSRIDKLLKTLHIFAN